MLTPIAVGFALGAMFGAFVVIARCARARARYVRRLDAIRRHVQTGDDFAALAEVAAALNDL